MFPKFISFSNQGRPGYGLVREDGIVDLSRHYGDRWPTLRAVVAAGALDELAHDAQGWVADLVHTAIHYEIPIPDAEKIICVGVNYPDRNAEYKDGQEAPPYPSLFLRLARSFVGHDEPLRRPPESVQLDYEGEIVVVIGKGGRRIPAERALEHVAGLSLCNEGTIRDWVRHAKFNVTQGKNFDGSGAIGPYLVPFSDPAQMADITLETRVNGAVRQHDRTGRMIFPVAYLVSYISTFTTLTPGDMIVTGTPTGAGARHDPPIWLKPGDVVEVQADGLGTLRNSVIDEGESPC
ncbi:fumarylacetoacetate hydrolase family protein [Gluconacetobacter entanii]|uniref:2-hydroxyhepta-2,4-diene-1,7-dioate isomerase n=1 Tax=Gluconacetobacter entanii TaxID=108528 RepID=A0A318PQD6_9PROT|nr:fumarylacetoacetate hydrolase family protein [Gluconacetobacter entanii]MBE7618224.1 2-hydroxyhepta-2,4-diene-1,7-dioate isomerase [Komagataeibacter sp. FXV2]MCE2578922.1 fumarylacetoacetate hydrolase family protein [Komagataeibacter sp. FNDCR1]PYD62670.1 2-hydroxyhepta-2,4-diene-1,7-dioate isomerase [Gluconacetobacter entanii]